MNEQRSMEIKETLQEQYSGVQGEALIAGFQGLSQDMNTWFSSVQGFARVNFDGDCMLVVTELAEAVEANRHGAFTPSDKIPGFLGVEEELADALVRIFHIAGKYRLRLGEAFCAKMQHNLARPFKHGKEY